MAVCSEQTYSLYFLRKDIDMTDIPKTYIVDENNKKIAVQLDISTFEKIEEILENFGLVQLINEVDNEETLSIAEAKVYYQTLDKKK